MELENEIRVSQSGGSEGKNKIKEKLLSNCFLPSFAVAKLFFPCLWINSNKKIANGISRTYKGAGRELF